MKSILSAALCLVILAGCAASTELVKIKLESGRIYEVAKTRSGVEFADCGTQLVSYLFDEKGTFVDSKSERGHALHCDLSVAIIDAGAAVGAANQIRRGIAAGADSVTNSFSNSQAQGQDQIQTQGQVQQSTVSSLNTNVNTIKVKDITNNSGGSESKGKGPHGNNGFGNGGNDGSPNGKNDSDR